MCKSPVISVSKRWIGSDILVGFFYKIHVGLGKESGRILGFFKKAITRTNVTVESQLSNRTCFWFTSMLYFSFIFLAAHV